MSENACWQATQRRPPSASRLAAVQIVGARLVALEMDALFALRAAGCHELADQNANDPTLRYFEVTLLVKFAGA